MSEFDIFMELIDEKTLDYILCEYFSDNNPKLTFNVKKIKLQKLLREPVSKKMKKIYRVPGLSCLQILKMELVDKDLIDCDLDNFIETILSKEYKNSNLILFLTAYLKFPDAIEGNFDLIIENHKHNNFLFKGIDKFNLSDNILATMELSKLKEDIKLLKDEMKKIQLDLEISKNENNLLSNQINNITNENKKLKKDTKKFEKEFNQIKNENNEIKKDIENKKNLLLNKSKEITNLKSNHNELEKDYKNLKIDNNNLNKKYIEINEKYKEIKNKEYIDINNEQIQTEYEVCFIYTSPIPAIRSLFREVLFISYEEFSKEIESIIDKIHNFKIDTLFIMSNNLSTRELGILKRRVKKEGLIQKTLLLSSELNMVKELIKYFDENTRYQDLLKETF